ncbi:MAG: macro domain-containing protein [Stomatobaculum sp.]|nr:macro domain-containing protein [Stomatobaculum sp.]
MPLQIIRNDITKVEADAIVNSANPDPVCGRGVDYAIYKAAGAKDLLAARKKIGPIKPGETAVTPAFFLPARVIIHTVVPDWIDGKHWELEYLASCYRKSLMIAKVRGCESIAFPLLSTGACGFPKDQALSVALREIRTFLEENEMDVILVVYNKDAFDLSTYLVEDVRQFIDDHYVGKRGTEEYDRQPKSARKYPASPGIPSATMAQSPPEERRKGRLSGGAGFKGIRSPFRREKREDILEPVERRPKRPKASKAASAADYEALSKDIDEAEVMHESAAMCESAADAHEAAAMKDLPRIMNHIGESFQERLLHLIDERGLTDAEVYKKANVDRKLFSKIRCNPEYSPSKRTAVALAVALRLNLDETADLLSRAGFALSPSSKFDLIVEYCIRQKIYDSYTINFLLFKYDQPVLGC